MTGFCNTVKSPVFLGTLRNVKVMSRIAKIMSRINGSFTDKTELIFHLVA